MCLLLPQNPEVRVRKIALDLGNLMTPEWRVFEHPPFGSHETVVLIPMAANQKHKVVMIFVVMHCHGDASVLIQILALPMFEYLIFKEFLASHLL